MKAMAVLEMCRGQVDEAVGAAKSTEQTLVTPKDWGVSSPMVLPRACELQEDEEGQRHLENLASIAAFASCLQAKGRSDSGDAFLAPASEA